VRLIKTEEFPTAAFVIVCDRSDSMRQSGALKVLDGFLPRMVTTLKNHQRVKETGILSVIGFSEDAEVMLPLTSIANVEGSLNSHLRCGKTDFRPPLEKTYQQLSQMPKWTRRCYRPVVFFLSDGQHNIGDARHWQQARQSLISPGFALRPTIVSLGMGDCNSATLASIASAPDLTRYFDGDPTEAIRSILSTVLKSTVTLSMIGREQAAAGGDDLAARIREFRYDDDGRGDFIEWRD
jgi:uncharacterized protein YegL